MNIRRRKRIKNDHHDLDLDLQKVRIDPDPGLVVVQNRPKRRAKRINVIGQEIAMMMNTRRTKRKVKRTRITNVKKEK